MRVSDEGEVCTLSIEPADEKNTVFQAIREQNKPIILVVPSPTAKLASPLVFGRPEDYSELKRERRRDAIPPIYLVSQSKFCREQAIRIGLPAYYSIEEFTVMSQELASTDFKNDQTAMSTSSPLQPSSTTKAHSHASSAFASPRTPPRKRSRLFFILIGVTLLLVVGSILGGIFLYFHAGISSASPGSSSILQSVGNVYFLSSEQVNVNNNQGINDEVQIDLKAASNPSPGNNFYAWLLPDKGQGDANALMLGTLVVRSGHASLLYPGDQQHNNLLATYSRFLITEENASVTPIAPSPDVSTWRYYSEIPQGALTTSTGLDATGKRPLSLLDHLRHLLVNDPTLNAMGLSGGLNNWLYRNTGKLLEWALSARDYDGNGTDPQFLRRQIIRVLAYLDGLTFVQQDLPANTYLPLTTRLVRMGLIDIQDNQQVPSYLSHIVYHLNGLLNSVGVTPQQRARASQIVAALDRIHVWLAEMRSDAQQLEAMSDTQLFGSKALTLYNDMVLEARAANDGQINPDSAQIQEGVVWVHMMLSSLATLAVEPYSGS